MSGPEALSPEVRDRSGDRIREGTAVRKARAESAIGRFWVNNWKSVGGWIVVLVAAAFTVGTAWTSLDNRVAAVEKSITKIEPVLDELGKVVTRLEVLVEKLEPRKGTK